MRLQCPEGVSVWCMRGCSGKIRKGMIGKNHSVDAANGTVKRYAASFSEISMQDVFSAIFQFRYCHLSLQLQRLCVIIFMKCSDFTFITIIHCIFTVQHMFLKLFFGKRMVRWTVDSCDTAPMECCCNTEKTRSGYYL